MYGKTYLRLFVANTGRISLKIRQINDKSHSLQKVGWQLSLEVSIDEVNTNGGKVAERYIIKPLFPRFLLDLFRDELGPRSQQTK